MTEESNDPLTFDLTDAFFKRQEKLRGDLGLGDIATHPGTKGDDTELNWLRMLAELLPRRGLVARIRRWLVRLFGGRTPLDRVLEALLGKLTRAMRQMITEQMMSLQLGSTRLMLGRDLQQAFPTSLATLSDPELRSLLARIDPTPDSTKQSGATDWVEMRERMHYIADLFRCYQESAELFAPPFSDEQVGFIFAGHLPADAF